MKKEKKEFAKDSQLDSWNILEQDFPPSGSSYYDKLLFLLKYAILAPSGHNTQPWLFRVVDKSIELYADRTRALPVVDPEDRELTISCGAALYHLVLAARHFRYDYSLEIFPSLSIDNDDLLARVILEHDSIEGKLEEEDKLFQAITKRRTNRSVYENRDVPDSLLLKLEAAAVNEPFFSTAKTGLSSVWIHIAKQVEEKNTLADLITEGDNVQLSDKRFRRELASWLHPNRSQSRDGIPGYAFGFSDIMSLIGPFVIRTFDIGERQAAKDRQLASGSPVLLVMGSNTDEPLDWLHTGMVMANMLLLARSECIWASFLNQPIEVPELRPKVREAIYKEGFPQLLLRMGYAQDVKPTPRRPIEEILRSRQ
jgi:nitroreductase